MPGQEKSGKIKNIVVKLYEFLAFYQGNGKVFLSLSRCILLILHVGNSKRFLLSYKCTARTTG